MAGAPAAGALTVVQPRLDDRNAVAAIFGREGFITDLGVSFDDCGPGGCTSRLVLAPRHLQVAELIGTMAPVTA